jgi:hypothetical protein
VECVSRSTGKATASGFSVAIDAVIRFTGTTAGSCVIVAFLLSAAACGSRAGINRENAMSNQEWWAAERKAAEFWRKVKENQTARYDCPIHGKSAASTARNLEFGAPIRRYPLGL